mmetsp:Transcript_50643/g.144726  ORF Transcript_50643/g.144726 Transcript_50643/m.144726 type:complete len:90 (-) Transcript_50643:87-356(-)
MDGNKDGEVTRDEARVFFKGNFGKLSASAMFNEVDNDDNGKITKTEFISFWTQVRRSGYREEEILEEVDSILKGGAWVDWNDQRSTGNT